MRIGVNRPVPRLGSPAVTVRSLALASMCAPRCAVPKSSGATWRPCSTATLSARSFHLPSCTTYSRHAVPTGLPALQLPAAALRLPAWSSRADPQAIVHALRCRTVQLSESARVALRQVAKARSFGSLIVLQIIAARNLPPPGTRTLPLQLTHPPSSTHASLS